MSSISTRPADTALDELVRARWMRRTGLGILGVVVLAGVFNLLGVRRDVVSAAGDGYRLDVRYTQVTRPGLASTWEVLVARDGGFDQPIAIAVNADYFDRFDFNQFYPEPSSTLSRGGVLLLEFEEVEGERFVLRFDGRATPTFVFDVAEASTALEVDGREVARVDYRTVVMP